MVTLQRANTRDICGFESALSLLIHSHLTRAGFVVKTNSLRRDLNFMANSGIAHRFAESRII
jgi:hypothetical protein